MAELVSPPTGVDKPNNSPGVPEASAATTPTPPSPDAGAAMSEASEAASTPPTTPEDEQESAEVSAPESSFFKRVRDRVTSALEHLGVKTRPEFSTESLDKARQEAGNIDEGNLLIQMAGEKIKAGKDVDVKRAEAHQKALDTKEQLDAQKNAHKIIKKALNGRPLSPEEYKVIENIAAGGADQLTLKDLATSIMQETTASAEVVVSRGAKADREWSHEETLIKQTAETEIEARSYAVEVVAKTSGFEQEKPSAAEVKKLLQETRPLARRQVVAEQMWLRKLSDVSTSLTERFPDQAEEHTGNLEALLQKVAEGKKSADTILHRETDLRIEPQEFHDAMLSKHADAIEEAKKIGQLELYLQMIDCRTDENGLIVPEETTPPPHVLMELYAEKRATEAWKKVEEILALAKTDSLVADRLVVAIEQFDQLNSAAEIASARSDRTDAWAMAKAKNRHEKEVATFEKNDAKLQKQLEKESKVSLLERMSGFLSRKLGQVKERIDAKQTAKQEARAGSVQGLEAQKLQNETIRVLMATGMSLETATKTAGDLAALRSEEAAPPAAEATPAPEPSPAPEPAMTEAPTPPFG